MMHTALQIRTRCLTAIMAGMASIGIATAATAAGVGVNAGGAAQAGGPASAHMSSTATTHSNAQWQSGATRGVDRALEREGTSVVGTEPSTASERETPAQARRPTAR